MHFAGERHDAAGGVDVDVAALDVGVREELRVDLVVIQASFIVVGCFARGLRGGGGGDRKHRRAVSPAALMSLTSLLSLVDDI